MSSKNPFLVGISPDFQSEAAGLLEPFLKEIFLPYPFIHYEFFPCSERVKPQHISNYDAIITLHPRFDKETFIGITKLAVIARWGVGYDMIDVPTCTEANVLLAITTDAVRRPVAEANIALILALAKKLPAKDKIVRSGRWDLKAQVVGLGLSGKAIGSIGLGNIASEMFRLLEPFDLDKRFAYDPYVSQEHADLINVRLVDLEMLFRESDFLTINCALNDETRGMVNAELLSLMKPTAYLINTARGPIVRQADLIDALQSNKITGAGLDVFDQEPLPADSPLTQLENVILSPHALAWTDDLYRGNGIGACKNVLTILRGGIPRHTVNKGVIDQAEFQRKICALRNRWNECETKSARD